MASKKTRRTRSEVLAARRNAIVGCCSRFADMQSCDCLETALPDEPVNFGPPRKMIPANHREESVVTPRRTDLITIPVTPLQLRKLADKLDELWAQAKLNDPVPYEPLYGLDGLEVRFQIDQEEKSREEWLASRPSDEPQEQGDANTAWDYRRLAARAAVALKPFATFWARYPKRSHVRAGKPMNAYYPTQLTYPTVGDCQTAAEIRDAIFQVGIKEEEA